jgi:hypothetical protein
MICLLEAIDRSPPTIAKGVAGPRSAAPWAKGRRRGLQKVGLLFDPNGLGEY